MDNHLIKAIRLAAKVHKGQVDRFEEPYILHVVRVVARGRDMDEQVLGALHDILERSDLTTEDLRDKGFPDHILVALEHITRYQSETYEQYIERVAANGLAVRVKVHDLSDKMDLRNVGHLDENDLKRYNKQLAAFERLKRLESTVRAQLTLGSKSTKTETKAK